MRLFEVFLLIACTSFPLLRLVVTFRSKEISGIAFIISIFSLHFFAEGLRWQMLPAYLLLLLILIIWFFKIRIQGKLLKLGTTFFFLIFLFTAWLLPILLPVFKLPKPKGPYQIGAQYLKVTSNRLEIITGDKAEKRTFMVKVWYPSNSQEEEMESYLDKGNRLGFSNKYGLPNSITNYLDYVNTNTRQKPPIADGKFPVLIFSHGSNSEAYGYYALIEEIVSHGFIVLNINHTYESSGSLFPDGDIKLYNRLFDQNTNDAKMREMAWNATQSYHSARNESEQLMAVQNLIENYIAADISMRWSKDIIDLIDHLFLWEENSFLNSHMELEKIGVFGHSQGGSAIGQALKDDNRIKAGINLDGVQWGEMINSNMDKPLLLLSSDWDKDHLDLNKFAYRNLKKSNFKSLVIKNTGHSNFMDIPLIVNSSKINEAGKIAPLRSYEITHEIVLDFFNQHLYSQRSRFEELLNAYQEIEIKN
ncbi:alpha/beta hydrolase family protein [Mongoliibacter ruber]|uniref:Platelet-activating factor acetylhydrolase isoform II n=1 Tax=Mongoliibacter ruber TaxID=1750599 RepID=A0A2T0WCA0_9BACT|nr:hypothetical protein [Mongoliibacter ruber]PRY84329.1 platelet-activating factor acetylhydrolase isoform II [Mongoliibacter ruber]